MRILILNSWYYPNMKGGAEHSVKLLAENLCKRGHEVGVFTIDADKGRIIKETINGVDVYRGTGIKYDIRKAYYSRKNIFQKIHTKILETYNPSIIQELDTANSEFNPDIVHINCISGISLAAISFFDKKGIPIVYTVRDYFLDSPKNIIERKLRLSSYNLFLLPLFRFYARRLTKNINAVTAPSEFTLRYMLSKGYFSKTTFAESIVNCVDIVEADLMKYIAEKNDHANRIFMYAGSITAQKGIKPMINAFMRTELKTKLYVCGEGDLSNWVRECSERDNRIEYKGKLSTENLVKIYRLSDIIIVPSLWAEPFGRVVIEGAKYGLVVLGSDKGGIPEIISKLGCGITCDVTDEKGLMENMEKIYTANFDEYHEAVLRNIDYYSTAKQIKQFLSLYQKCLSNKKR